MDTGNFARSRPADKPLEAGISQLNRPASVCRVVRDEARPAEGMHPFGQIMKILAIPIPFQPLVNRFTGSAFLERFADPETTCGRMLARGFVIEPADPPAAQVIVAIPSQHAMHLIDQISSTASIYLIACLPEQFEEVANRKCIRPKVSLLLLGGWI